MKPLHLLLSVVAVACLAAVPLGVTNTYYLHLIETIMILNTDLANSTKPCLL